MFSHNKRLQYTVHVTESNPGLANLLSCPIGRGEIDVEGSAAAGAGS